MNHPVLFFLILLFPGFSFAVTAEDFPCFFSPDEYGECWTQIKDPRDGQVYLAIKHCGVSNSRSSQDTCVVYYVENSRFKVPSAKCGEGRDFYYGCLYPENETLNLACPDFGVRLTMASYFDALPAYYVTSEEYAKIREEILKKKKKTDVRQMFFYRVGDPVAATSGYYAWVKINGRWGETTIQKKEVYVACEYWMSGD